MLAATVNAVVAAVALGLAQLLHCHLIGIAGMDSFRCAADAVVCLSVLEELLVLAARSFRQTVDRLPNAGWLRQSSRDSVGTCCG